MNAAPEGERPNLSAGESLRVGFCAILGPPNAGKSTLLNQLLGVRLCAVSPRPQTTRDRIVGICHRPGDEETEAAQIIFVDTPGFTRGPHPLRRYMYEQAFAAAGECDVALWVVDVTAKTSSGSAAAAATEALAAVEAPTLLALNKIDRLANKEELLPILEAYSGDSRFAEVIPISALRADGLDRLTSGIALRLPRGPRLYPEETLTDRAERFLAGELIREQLFRQLGQEIPYATAVVVEAFEERAQKGDAIITASIHVERESHKPMVIGKGGQRIKQVGAAARRAISQLFGRPVHVKLVVKVTPNWSRSPRGIREMGYQ